jgi:hypothetical protein
MTFNLVSFCFDMSFGLFYWSYIYAPRAFQLEDQICVAETVDIVRLRLSKNGLNYSLNCGTA